LLMECLGKVLEQVVTQCLAWDSDALGLLPPTQFGSQAYHCAKDAAAFLHEKVESMQNAGCVGALVLFNISRFFDHLDAATVVQTLAQMGVAEPLIHWTHSLMSQQTVYLSFKGIHWKPLMLTRACHRAPLSPPFF
jgi:hypothetical protein